jgi:hypothetical protein
MTSARVIRYTTHPEAADENERLVRAVYAELAGRRPDGLHYATLRLDDGVTFVHIAVLDGDENPLPAMAAFGEFQADLQSRCAEGPAPAGATVIGSYRLLPG